MGGTWPTRHQELSSNCGREGTAGAVIYKNVSGKTAPKQIHEYKATRYRTEGAALINEKIP